MRVASEVFCELLLAAGALQHNNLLPRNSSEDSMRINYAKNEAIDFSIQRKRGDDLSAHSFRSCLSSNAHSAPSV